MKLYIKSLLPAAALALSLGLSSCVGDLNVKPIDPKTNMTVTPDNLFNKCYANMAVAGNGGANGDLTLTVSMAVLLVSCANFSTLKN